jgi:ribosome-associated protein
MTETAAKKDIQKLQRSIVDALEDVKAQEIQVFDTEHLSSLFERVIIASGTSNRQTKALAASVRDKVRQAGFSKPRMEGEDNGEWIIVDCGPAVVHVMQPTIRSYYNLEEIWGGTPVRLKLGAPKPVASAEVKGHIKNSVVKKAVRQTTAAKTPAAKKSGVRPAEKKTAAKVKPALKASAKSVQPAAKSAVKTATKTVVKSASKSGAKPSRPSSKLTVKTVSQSVGKSAVKGTTKTASQAITPKKSARKAVQAATRRKAD